MTTRKTTLKKKINPMCHECGEVGKKGRYNYIDGVKYFICDDCREAFFS